MAIDVAEDTKIIYVKTVTVTVRNVITAIQSCASSLRSEVNASSKKVACIYIKKAQIKK